MAGTRTGVTYAEGFEAAGVNCGFKQDRHDLALVYTRAPATAAGCFTTNKFTSYSLQVCRRNIGNPVHGVIVNSGNANTCNGPENLPRTREILDRLGERLGVPPRSLLIASTGLIGIPFDHAKVIAAIPALVAGLSVENHEVAARAIMTTDTRLKETRADTGIAGRAKEVVIGGMAKGAGMIHPNMATMLCFLTTDAVVAPDALSAALRAAVDDSFNMITVDNDQSTNDTVVCLANGAAGNERIHPDSASYAPFAAALRTACVALAREIAGDGEGATRRIEVTVRGARMLKDARRGARQIAGSSLVKSAAAGAWPNFGRILAALGSTTARFDPKAVELSVCGVPVHRGGPLPFDEAVMRRLLSGKEVVVDIDLKKGPFSATAWGCDLTEEYVRINLEE